jgi:hypothetical protein
MPLIAPTLPTIGQPVSTEDPKVISAFQAIVSAINGNLDSANLHDGAVTAAKVEAQQAWQSAPLTGFVGPSAIEYFKDSLGMVHFRGDRETVGGSNIAANASLATLPPGYRPGTQQYFVLASLGGTPIHCYVTTAGVIAPATGLFADAAYAFGNIHFRAEN